MILNPALIATREKLILTGIYLSKYESLGLKRLGFQTFAEAYNVVGYALGSLCRPPSKTIAMNSILFSQTKERAGTSGRFARIAGRSSTIIKAWTSIRLAG